MASSLTGFHYSLEFVAISKQINGALTAALEREKETSSPNASTLAHLLWMLAISKLAKSTLLGWLVFICKLVSYKVPYAHPCRMLA